MVVVDTSVIIDHLRQIKKDSFLLKIEKQHTLAISTITVQELFAGESTKDENDERQLLATISSLTTLHYNFEIAKLAGEFTRDSRLALTFADAAIAATAIINGCQLATLNIKDFKKIPALELI